MAKAICRQCGAEMLPGTKYCVKCGNTARTGADTPPVDPPTVPRYTAPVEPNPVSVDPPTVRYTTQAEAGSTSSLVPPPPLPDYVQRVPASAPQYQQPQTPLAPANSPFPLRNVIIAATIALMFLIVLASYIIYQTNQQAENQRQLAQRDKEQADKARSDAEDKLRKADIARKEAEVASREAEIQRKAADLARRTPPPLPISTTPPPTGSSSPQNFTSVPTGTWRGKWPWINNRIQDATLTITNTNGSSFDGVLTVYFKHSKTQVRMQGTVGLSGAVALRETEVMHHDERDAKEKWGDLSTPTGRFTSDWRSVSGQFASTKPKFWSFQWLGPDTTVPNWY